MRILAALHSNAALLCAVVLVQFGLIEAGYRLRGGSEAAPEFQTLFTPDPVLGYRLKPGATARLTTAEFDSRITINQAGVRDREIEPKATGERRLVVLGDSLVMSVQVPLEDTFVARLEQRLNASATPPATYRVINAGVQGYGPVEEYLFHRDVTSALQADVVILGLYPGNDAVEAAATAFRLREGGAPRQADDGLSARQRFTQWRRRMIRKSVVLQVARLRVTTALDRFGWRPEIDPPLRTYLADAPPEIARGVAVTRDAVARLAALTDSQGARLVVVLLPARFQVDDDDYGRLKEIVERSGRTLDRDLATERFATALEGLGVPVLDVLPPLREAARISDVYMQSTAHFTPFGHDALATILKRRLRDEGLVPGTAR
jgi:lysophospholipase L1-like esterase